MKGSLREGAVIAVSTAMTEGARAYIIRLLVLCLRLLLRATCCADPHRKVPFTRTVRSPHAVAFWLTARRALLI